MNSVDEFVFEGKGLGTLQYVTVRHDNSGSSTGWFIKNITVQDLETYQNFNFPCDQWLAVDQADGAIERKLMEQGRLEYLPAC